MKQKKSESAGLNMLVLLAIGVGIAVVTFFIIEVLAGGTKVEAANNLEGTKDPDMDNVYNLFDQCKCDYGESEDGCPADTPDDSPLRKKTECS